ncbi:unnamed protein product [Kuraishia capsulata CBS 1993]|uniref:Anhydro-N-acetylmuramic acid kinase n=1 Tax=Kuraishia capsulata CBS 1993 TaxID=1382522 RepID=W6MV67_9ASCO|nr:uncharacterized protein KUCA_T00002071001 [Kuraishia capsulata CBS 1993]CDK26100.1 unnamed protein product [Kuraishia capsulata CBS 1993]
MVYPLTVLGINCGTSVDGVDIVVSQIETTKIEDDQVDLSVKVVSYEEAPIGDVLKNRILRCCIAGNTTTSAELCDLNFAIGEEIGNDIRKADVDLSKIDLVASHAQPIWHEPRGKDRNSTLEFGEPASISYLSGKTVVSGFRSMEVAVGRQGAPLCGFLEYAILRSDKVIITQNIGGIGNASVIDPLHKFYQFDTGPGNVLVDAAVRIITNGKREYDAGGEMGLRGEKDIDQETVDEVLSNYYFALSPPKTTGRELFSDKMSEQLVRKLQAKGLSDDAVIATITRITAESIAKSYDDFVVPQVQNNKIDEIYISGGGAHNEAILQHLRNRFPEAKVGLSGSLLNITADSKEAVAFSVLGYCTINGIMPPVPRFVETDKEVLLGNITPGDNIVELFGKVRPTRSHLRLRRIEIIS